MATLCERQQYALTSHLNHSIDKSLIFVKLTDSALKAIEDYLNHKGSLCANSKPSIEFRSNDSQGVISIPSKSNVENESQRFSFTLANVDAVEPQGSFECIQQTKYKSIESLGNIDYKLQIHANDDSYQKTKVKMAVVERENKKNSTKVIKASDPNVGRKVKVKRHMASVTNRVTPHSQSAQVSQPAAAVHTGHNGHNKPYSPPTLKLNGNTINGIPNNKTSVSNNSINNSLNNSKTNSINNYMSFNTNQNLDSNLTETKRPLKELVVHFLALRPLKKSEIIQRLSIEGIDKFDKKELNSILNSVSTVRDNVYELTKTGWNEVQPDWDDYTSEEKESVKSIHPLFVTQQTLEPITDSTAQNEISPLSDCGSMPIFSSPMSIDSPIGSKSPTIYKRSAESSILQSVAKKHKPLVSCQTEITTNNTSDKSPNTKLKTNGYNHLLNGWANKPSSPERDSNLINPNINLINTNGDLKTTPDPTLSNASQASPDSNPMYLSQQQFHNQTNRVISYLPNDNSFSKSQSRNAFNRFKTNGYHMTNGNGSDSINSSPNSSPDSGTGSHDGSTLSSSNSYTLCTNDETPDYLSKYSKIMTNEQRAQYKRDFYIEYEEYRRLYRYIDGVAAKFTELEIRLNTKAEGSDEWNKLMDQIVKEYEDTKNCPKFQKCRKRMFYLHEKLAHIKGLVLEYDRNYHKEKNRLSHKLQLKSNPMS